MGVLYNLRPLVALKYWRLNAIEAVLNLPIMQLIAVTTFVCMKFLVDFPVVDQHCTNSNMSNVVRYKWLQDDYDCMNHYLSTVEDWNSVLCYSLSAQSSWTVFMCVIQSAIDTFVQSYCISRNSGNNTGHHKNPYVP